jgi:hypothetical protein
LPQKPGGNTKWYRHVVSQGPKSQNQAKRSVEQPAPIKRILSAPTRKKRRVNDNDTEQTDGIPEQAGDTPEQAGDTPEQTEANPNPNPIAQAILDQSWWDTGDAIRYFGAIDGEVSPKEAVKERIAQLQRGYTTATGWKLVIDDFDQQDLCSLHESFIVQLKCRYVSLALRYALEDMPDKKWHECCQDAIDSINRVDGVEHVKNNQTVSRWHLAFRRNNEAFPVESML